MNQYFNVYETQFLLAMVITMGAAMTGLTSCKDELDTDGNKILGKWYYEKNEPGTIGEVTLESKAAIDAARAAFEVLTEAEEAQITAVELETLLAAEAAYAALAKSTIEFKGKDGASDISSKQEAIYYPAIPDGYHWQTEENNNVSEDKTIVIKAVSE